MPRQVYDLWGRFMFRPQYDQRTGTQAFFSVMEDASHILESYILKSMSRHVEE